MSSPLTDYQAKYFTHELQRSYANDHVGKLAGLLFDAQVEPKPHQIDAALFALQTPFLPGVILADEVGLGKTIEAGIVISQYWAERRRGILIVAPSSLRQQWQQELHEKFLIPSAIIDSELKDTHLSKLEARASQVLICSYEFALRNEVSLLRSWDLAVADEAHRLRSHWTGKTKAAQAIANIVQNAHKTMLLTATPLQNRLEELYGLVTIFDPSYFYSLDAFRERYIKNRDLTGDDDLVDRVATISKRTLRRDADKYIHFTKRLPITVGFTPSPEETRLYKLVNAYLQREELFAFAATWATSGLNWPVWIVSTPSLAASFSIEHAIFDRWLWRKPIFRSIGLVSVRDVSGKYNGRLISTYRDMDGHQVKRNIGVRIEQTWTQIEVTMTVEGGESSSRSQLAVASVSN